MSNAAQALQNSDVEGFLLIANEILRKCKINGELIETLEQCSDSFFAAVYEAILGEPLKGLIPEALSYEDKVHNCTTVIDALSCDILNVDLSHITAEDIVDGDVSSIQNLLEIFKELLDFILDVDVEDEANDSNLLSSDHEVISDVLNQELRSSYYDSRKHTEQQARTDDDDDEPHTMDTPPMDGRPLIDVDISMIPKWTKSVGSSASCETNSTDEIIRESEILEQQLAREYPSLHKSREQNHPKERMFGNYMSDEQPVREEMPSKGSGVVSGTIMGSQMVSEDVRSVRHVTGARGGHKDRGSTMRDKQELGAFGAGDIVGLQATSRDIRTPSYMRGSRVDERDKAQDRLRDIRGTHAKSMDTRGESSATRGTQGKSRDTETLSPPRRERKQYCAGSNNGKDNDEEQGSTLRDVRGKSGDTGGESSVTRGTQGRIRDIEALSPPRRERSEYGATDGTVSSKQDQGLDHEGSESADRVANGYIRGSQNDYELSVSGNGSGTQIGASSLTRTSGVSRTGVRMAGGTHESGGTTRDNVRSSSQGMRSTKEGLTVGHNRETLMSSKVGEHSRLKNLGERSGSKSCRNFDQKSELQAKHGRQRKDREGRATDRISGEDRNVGGRLLGSDGGVLKSYGNLDRDSELREKYGRERADREGSAPDRPMSGENRGVAGGIGGERGRDKEKTGYRSEQRSERSRVDVVVPRMQRSETQADDGTQRGSLGLHMVDRVQTGTLLRQGLGRVGDDRRTKKKEKVVNVGDSDTSGALWDDQISPLDASEQGMGTSMAFDHVGTNRTVGDKRTVGTSSDMSGGYGSSVFRHYHHHFHHPHGSTEDLVQDLENVTRAERDENGRPRSVAQGRASVMGQKSSDDRSAKSPLSGETRVAAAAGKRSVKFDDNVDTLLITSRLERLRKEIENDEVEQEQRRVVMKTSYGGHLEFLNKERKRIEKEVNQLSKTVPKSKSGKVKRNSAVRRKSRDSATQAIYGKAGAVRKARFPSSKARKRSTSASPKIQPRKKTAKQLEKGDVILPTMLEEFPFLHLSPHTMQTMRRKQSEQLTSLSKSSTQQQKQTKTQKMMEDAERRQQTLLKILRKDLLHNQRMRDQKERSEQERTMRTKLREKRQASARARRYYEDYQLRMRARLLKRRTREEQVFKNLFQDGLAIQKQRVNELRTYAKEQREVRAKRQQNELESLENYYRDQYSILAETISREKEALQIREKAQEKVVHQMQRNLRVKLQKEVTDIQETLVRDEDDAYFRRLDAERLRKQMQMTAFQNFS